MNLRSPIHHTFGPHVDKAYLRRTLALSYRPWAYRSGPDRDTLRHALRERYGMDATLFASGREALLALLQSLQLPNDSEVIVQGFTCVVVPNAIHAAGLKTVYADIEEKTLNLTPETVSAAATEKAKVVICQHTFGIPSPTEELKQLCDARGWILIEDCAHILPDRSGPQDILRYSDYAILSFGRDKAISGIGGGAVLSRNASVAEQLRSIEASAPEMSFWDVLRLLEYPSRMAHCVRPLIGLGLAGPVVAIQHLFGLFAPVLTDEEKKGRMPSTVRKMPNACAALAAWQLELLERINDHRRTLTRHYLEICAKHGWNVLHRISGNLPLQKFPMFVRNATAMRAALRTKNIHLDDGWTGCVVCPGTCDASAAGYQAGSDPAAETASKSVLSLPTHPTMTIPQTAALERHLSTLLRS